MLITTDGIVIRERFVGENDKYIDVLTKDLGLIEINIKGARKSNSKNSSSTQLFAYSKFCFSKKKDRYYLNSSEPIKIFYNLRLDIKKLALASYFAEVLKYSVVSEEPADMVLRLFLNSLHYLANGERAITFIKSIFELRFLTEIGLMPDLLACKDCNQYSSEKMYFNITEGYFTCCESLEYHENENVIIINATILHTMRYIVLSEFEKIFSFKINDYTQKKLSIITEQYLLSHLNRNFKTLEFYKSI